MLERQAPPLKANEGNSCKNYKILPIEFLLGGVG